MAILFGKKQKETQPEGPVLWQTGGQTEKVSTGEEKPLYVNNVPVNPKALPGHGQIITVQCAKHGDGATTIATNIAALLAMTNPENVALIDLDGYGSVRSRLGLPVDECLINIMDWEDVKTPREIASRMYAHSSGVMVIPGVVHYDHITKIKPALVFKILTILKEQFDYIVADCPPVSTNNNTWAASVISDAIITVIKPDRTSLDLLGENKGFMLRLGCQERVLTVLNQAGIPGAIRTSDLLENEKIELNICTVLPYSTSVAEANNRRELIAATSQRNEFSRSLHTLTDKM